MATRIAERLKDIYSELPEGVRLIAVSKFHPAELIREAYDAGQRNFGESRVQELLAKKPLLPEDIEWHFIGHLQTNKVKQLVGNVSLIESVDSERLLAAIDSESEKKGVVSNVLLQVHVAREETKFGFSPEEIFEYFAEARHRDLKATHICGLMAMASNTDDVSRVTDDFTRAAGIFRSLKEKYKDEIKGFDLLSMGMSGDWPLAVEAASNMVRIGSAIFGERQY